jgi:DNA-binding NarL/FixJ family response regulator
MTCPAVIELLVADDDVRVLSALGETIALEDDLSLVAVAADAVAAHAWACDRGPAVALVDVYLPDRPTGIDLIRALAARPGWVVVAMSVRSGPRDAALAAGAVAFVEKGGDIEAILRTVRAAGLPRASRGR